MHWADKIAEDLIKEHPNLSSFTCASGITPSGPVHVGNLRDIATISFVAKALRDRNRNVRLIHSWDDYDRFRKIPEGIPDSYSEFLGKPISKVPDPTGKFPSYAARFETEFEQSLRDLGMEVEFRYQTVLYESGVYAPGIVKAFRARETIFDIINSYRTQKTESSKRSLYLPIEIYCGTCGRDKTQIETINYETLVLTYRCAACHIEETIDLNIATNVKLPWKIDWPMRWAYEGVTFEPGGKDHATKNGSFYVASEIASTVYGIAPPKFQPYEFIGLKGIAGKMSSSSGLLLTPSDALSIYQPEVLLWLFAKFVPLRAFDLPVDKHIFQIYDGYDHALASGNSSDTVEGRAIELSAISGRRPVTIPFKQLASFVNIVKGDCDALLGIFARLGEVYTKKDIGERTQKAEAWFERFAPDERLDLLKSLNSSYYETLSNLERQWVGTLYDFLKQNARELDEISIFLYAIPKDNGVANKESQKKFFVILYHLLFGRDKGPRLGPFFAAMNPNTYMPLLCFGKDEDGTRQ